MSIRPALYLAILLFAAPVQSATWYLDIGQARVTTDSFSISSLPVPEVTTVPSFRRDLTVVNGGVTWGIGPASFTAGALFSGTDSFQHLYPVAPTFMVPVDHRVSVYGARAAWTPHFPLGGGWEVDGAVGLLYLHRRITTGQLLAGTETQDDFAPYLGIGIGRWFTRNFGVRAGADVADGYQAISVGLRVAF